MNREQTLALLTQRKSALAERFGVRRLALLGSVARGGGWPDCNTTLAKPAALCGASG